ncbi:MAG: two component LuxR family transcriptional regulator [Acidobacteriaceae bacterium]|nr:two component LuxR family transcriptional regulator [Acidobacteriaceae bacterium]
MIRVLVVAGSSASRAGLEAIVRGDPRFTLVGDGARTVAASQLTRQFHPDVLLMEISEPGQFTRLQASMHGVAPSGVILLTTPLSRVELRRAYQSGVRAVLPRDANPAEIAAAIESVASGLAVITPEDLETLFPASDISMEEELAVGEPLTPRETEVLAMLAEGAGNKQIATRLRISEHTVKFHVSSILAKLGAATRTEAVARGFKEGLVII